MKKVFLSILIIVSLLCGCTLVTTPIPEKSLSEEKAETKKTEEPSEKPPVTEEKVTETPKTESSEKEQQPVKKETVEESVLSGKLIVVDAGHGLFSKGHQEAIAPGSSKKKPAFVSGTSGKNQSEEELNLSVSLKLRDALEKAGATVHMTRDTHETTRSNIDRAQFANELSADISVKLHADGSENKSARGMSMLVPGSQYIADKNLVEKSNAAGAYVLQAVVEETGAENRGISVRNDMTGFNWSEVPVILLEMGFMTNPDEDALLETDEYQNKIVSGIIKGLEEYFKAL